MMTDELKSKSDMIMNEMKTQLSEREIAVFIAGFSMAVELYATTGNSIKEMIDYMSKSLVSKGNDE